MIYSFKKSRGKNLSRDFYIKLPAEFKTTVYECKCSGI